MALVFEDSHHPGNIVNMFYAEGGIKLVKYSLSIGGSYWVLNLAIAV